MTYTHDYRTLATCDTNDLTNWHPIDSGSIDSSHFAKQGDAGITLYKSDTHTNVFGAERKIPPQPINGYVVALWLYIAHEKALHILRDARICIVDGNGNKMYYPVLRFLREGWNIVGLCGRYTYGHGDPDRIEIIRIELETLEASDRLPRDEIVMDYWVKGTTISVEDEDEITFDDIWRYVNAVELPVMLKTGGRAYELIGSITLTNTSMKEKRFTLTQLIPRGSFNSGAIIKFKDSHTPMEIVFGEVVDEKKKRGKDGGVFIYDFDLCHGGIFGGGINNAVYCYGTAFIAGRVTDNRSFGMWIYDQQPPSGLQNRLWNITSHSCPNLLQYDTDLYNWWCNENQHYCIQIRSHRPSTMMVIAKGVSETIRLGSFTYTTTVKNVRAENSTYLIYAWGCDGGVAHIYNVDTDTWKIHLTFTTGGSPVTIHFYYDTKFRLKDRDGNPLPNRTLKIYDKDGTLMETLTTNQNGETPTESLEYAYLQASSSGTYDYDDLTKRFPYTIEAYTDTKLEAVFNGVTPQNLDKPQTIELIEAVTTVTAQAWCSKAQYQTGENAVIYANFTDQAGNPVTGLTVTATVTKPDQTTSTITLKDDGTPPDETANDGTYTGSFTETQQTGTYHVTVNTTVSGIPATAKTRFEAGILESKIEEVKTELVEHDRKMQLAMFK